MLTMEWIPSAGLVVELNGKSLGETISDIGFFNTVIRNWIGNNPVDSNLKERLLGKAEEL
jgi:hypothetical protein